MGCLRLHTNYTTDLTLVYVNKNLSSLKTKNLALSTSIYGFNGKEKDKETGTQDYGMRIYNPSLGRFLSVDPLSRSYPWNSPYAFAENDVIRSIDLEGLEKLVVSNVDNQKRTATITIVKDIYIIKQANTPQEFLDINTAQVKANFAKGNTSAYVSNLPGKENFEFITETEYNNGAGYKVDIVYEVNVKIINPEEVSAINTGADKGVSTLVSVAPSNVIFSENSPARAGTGQSGSNSQGVVLNSKFDTKKFSTLPVEDVITHEAGDHNMKGELHTMINGKAFYPTVGLESNIKGQVSPTIDDTKQIISTAINRGNIEEQ